MATVAKKIEFKKSKHNSKSTRHSKKRPARNSAERFDPVADLEECKKIAKTVDVDAFMAFHKRNTASQKYWESKE